MFNWDSFPGMPYTNFHELNLDWFIKYFKEVFKEWNQLYTSLTEWKTVTDNEIQTILDRTNILINTYEEWVSTTQQNTDNITQLLYDVSELETKVLDLYNKKVNKPVQNGNIGQVLTNKGNNETEWTDKADFPEDLAVEIIDEWLTEHPEATTTVQDNSVTYAKLNSELTEISCYILDTYADIATSGLDNCFVYTKGYTQVNDSGHNIYYVNNGVITSATGKDVYLNYYIKNGVEYIYRNCELSANIATGIHKIYVKAGTYSIENDITLSDGTEIIFDDNSTINAYKTVYLNSSCKIENGNFLLKADITLFVINAYSRQQKWIKLDNVYCTGERNGESGSGPAHIGQNFLLVDCDGSGSETGGACFECSFNAYVSNVSYAYHFKRLTMPGGTGSGKVWLTANEITGRISHCYRYVFNDFTTNTYANNSLFVGAEMQAGYIDTSVEEQVPGSSVCGEDNIFFGKCWDFASGTNRQNTAIDISLPVDLTYIFHMCPVTNSSNTIRGIITGKLISQLGRFNHIQDKITFNTDLYSSSKGSIYLQGNIIHVDGMFRLGTSSAATIAADTEIFRINMNNNIISTARPLFIQKTNDNAINLAQASYDSNTGDIIVKTISALTGNTNFRIFGEITLTTLANTDI